MNPPRLLLLSPCLPFPKREVQQDDVDFFYYRNTMAQGVFQLRQVYSWHPLHLLAANLPVHTVVLENPWWRDMEEEMERFRPDIVGITFTVPMAGVVRDMVIWIKDHHPHVQVLVGGHGARIFEASYGVEAQIAARVDGICKGEGLSFLREWLKDHWQVEVPQGPLRQDLVPGVTCLFRTSIPLFRQVAVVQALGCPNGCPFCATSAAFQRARIPMARGRALFQALKEAVDRHPDVQSAQVFDENFLDDEASVREFMACMDQDPSLRERPVWLTVFASVQAISRYTVEELLRCGIGTLFVGVETFQAQILADEGLTKREGGNRSVADLFAELHGAGIHTLGSFIVGWDGHTRENLPEEIRRFVALNPTFYQVVPLHPVPGTPLWERLEREGRIREDYAYENDGISRSSFRPRHLTEKEVQDAVAGAYEALVAEGGPWPFRMLENLHDGWRSQREHVSSVRQAQARACRRVLPRLLPFALASGLLFRGAGFQRRWRGRVGLLLQDLPLLTAGSLFLAPGVLLVLGGVKLWGSLTFALSPHGDQPPTLRKEYGPGISPPG